mmetsp:Transcript_2047/g.4655  ORF Transcript_2047/g.4655 Transcript_2047/m.4655 type:complete len:539 (+) Transcript_2047:101-1717(+)
MIISTVFFLFSSLTSLHRVKADAFDDLWNQYMKQTEQAASSQYESTISRRERNLDHWDVPTAAAYLGLHPETLKPLPQYSESSSSSSSSGSLTSESKEELLDEYVGHDAAIMFYAQWDRNSHAIAPSWDAIATHINAGSRSSNLIMALFDCEKNSRHMEVCLSAGVKVYPTFMFVGSGEYRDTDFLTRSILGKDKSAGPYGAAPLKRTVKFQGNWQYGDQLLDWVNIMKGLSSWHSMSESGPLRGLRNGIFGFLTGGKFRGRKRGRGRGKEGKDGASLPVGIPSGFQTAFRGAGGASSSSSAGGTKSNAVDVEKMKELETKLNATEVAKDLYEKAVTHSSYLLEGLLFPSSNDDKMVDPFAILAQSDGWFSNATTLPPNSPNDHHPSILRSCVLELSIDYCNRITTRKTNAYLEELSSIPDTEPFPSMDEIEKRLLDDVKGQEPFCAMIETCMLTDFEDEECRPAKCPFENKAACNYLETCMNSNVQDEYGVALGLIEEGEKVSENDFGGRNGMKDDSDLATMEAGTGVGGWGIPVAN